MGGPGSGCWQRWDTRRVIDQVDCLDVRVLSRQGVLREGVHAVITWRQGRQSESSISLSCLGHEICLEYRTRIGSESWYPVRQEVALEWLPQKLGGRRVWLRCPDCQRRAALVYRSGRRGYVCRLCTGLPYKSESEVLEDRLCRRMRKLRKRVGAASGDEEQPLWHQPKPKYMHQSTYERIGELAEGVRLQLVQARNMKLVKLLSRYVTVDEGRTWGKGYRMARQRTPVEPAQDWTLTAEQATAVDLLASGKTLSETAVALDVPRQTVSEWCRLHAGVQAELNIRRQDLWTGTADRLRSLLPKALEVLAEEMEEGENRLHAAVHVLKACRLYGAELPIGSTDVGHIVYEAKVHAKSRRREEEWIDLV